MRREADRVLSVEPGPEAGVELKVDAALFAIALRGVIRAAKELCRPHAPAAVDAAVAKFEKRVPDAVHARNIVEHFDEYERGVGRLQKGGDVGQVMEWFVRDGVTYQLHISGKYVLDVREAAEEADELTDDVVTAVLEGSPLADHDGPS